MVEIYILYVCFLLILLCHVISASVVLIAPQVSLVMVIARSNDVCDKDKECDTGLESEGLK